MPVWISTPSKVYSPDLYMVGVGSAPTQKGADISAIEELAGQFGRDVSSKSVSSTRMSQIQKKDLAETAKISDFSQELMQKVQIEDLVGVEIIEHYQMPGKWYSLAVLDKEKGKQIITATINKNTNLINTLLDEFNEEDNSFESYSIMSSIYELCKINENLSKRLLVIDFENGKEGVEPFPESSWIKIKLHNLIAAIPVYIEVEGDLNNQVKQKLSNMVISSGFKTSDSMNARYQIKGGISIIPRNIGDGKFVQCNYSFEGNMYDSLTEEQMFPIEIIGRESSTDLSNATVKVYRVICSRIETTLSSTFISTIFQN